MENQDTAVVSAVDVFTFQCNDGGIPGCDWVVSGDNEELLIFQIEMHAQNNHNLVIDDSGKEKIRRCITRSSPQEHTA